MQKVKEKQKSVRKMVFKDYYLSLSRAERREMMFRLLPEIDISMSAFYNRIYGKCAWSKLEKERVSLILGIPIETLFPN